MTLFLSIVLAVYAVGWVTVFLWSARKSRERSDHDRAMDAAEVAFCWPFIAWLYLVTAIARMVRPRGGDR